MRRRYYPERIERRTHTRQFDRLTVEEKAQAVKRLARSSLDERHIAGLTGLSVEQVRKLIGS